MHAMWKPQKFKYIYLVATLYVFTLTLPSAAAVYWAFGDQLLTHSNAFSLLPRSRWRDAGVILMLIHQVIIFYNFHNQLQFLFFNLCSTFNLIISLNSNIDKNYNTNKIVQFLNFFYFIYLKKFRYGEV